MAEQRTSPTGPAGALALSLVLAHIALVTCMGQYYAKLRIPLGGVSLYPTELVVGCATLLGVRAIADVPWDRLSKLVVVFVGFGVVWCLVAGLGGLDGAGAKAFSFFIYSALFFVVRGSATDIATRRRVLFAIGATSVLGMAIGLWQMRAGATLLTPEFEETTTGSIRWLPGEFALYGVLASAIAIVEPVIRRTLRPSVVVILAGAMGELILAQHRSGFVALAAALVATAVVLGGSSQALTGLLKIVLIGATAIVLFAWLFGGHYIDETIQRISSIADSGDANIDWRLVSWYEVFDGIRQRPLGHGFAVWDFLFTSADPLTGSHNSYLDLTYRIGVPGLVAFAALPITLITRTRRLVQMTGPTEQLELVTICAAMMAFLVYASFNVVLETPYMSIFFWVLMGLGAAALPRDTSSPTR